MKLTRGPSFENRLKSSFFLFLVILIINAKRIPNFAGPYRVAFRLAYFKQYDENNQSMKYVGKLYCTPFKQKQLQYFWGYTDLAVPMTDRMKINVNVKIWSNNQWKENAFVVNFDRACSTEILYAKSVLPLLYGDDASLCPLPAKRREIRNQSHDIVFPQVPIFPYGRYLAQITLLEHGKTLGVMSVEADVVPKL